MEGMIKSYAPKNGYRFITADGVDYIFRVEFEPGQKVTFDAIQGKKGMEAINIRKTENETLRRHNKD